MENDSSEDVNDSARREAYLYKGKSIKQSTDIRVEEEPVSQRPFEELALVILRAMGS